ncbi:unnamed protein product [Protopolystoma xenopodis]|uniref:Cadherin domain-containing protein n=1 Tax=Protopolystoma xenopodis TaxID=117903 RepID=A0A448WFP9_9PLAT|nr:unnamed protein product [Protopolystoma xenopodis]
MNLVHSQTFQGIIVGSISEVSVLQPLDRETLLAQVARLLLTPSNPAGKLAALITEATQHEAFGPSGLQALADDLLPGLSVAPASNSLAELVVPVLLEASDGRPNQRPAHCLLLLHLTDINDHAPHLLSMEQELDQKVEVGAFEGSLITGMS